MAPESALLRALVLPMTPYSDPRRRRWVRRQAMSAISWTAWPDDEATGDHVAQLCLLRLLFLEREVRQVPRRGSDSAWLIARSAIETCIVGLYCHWSDEPVPRLRRQNADNLKLLLQFMSTPGVVPAAAVDQLAEVVLGPRPARGAPPLRQMAQAVTEQFGHRVAEDLYERFYVPLSALTAHASGLALLRHVDDERRPSMRPSPLGAARHAVHVTDACVGIVAATLTEGAAQERLAEYVDVHLARAMPPVVAMSVRNVRKNVRWKALPSAVRSLWDLRAYYRSGRANEDLAEERLSRTKDSLRRIYEALETAPNPGLTNRLLDEFAYKIAAAAATGEHAEP